VGSQETVDALLTLPHALRVCVEANQLERVALLEVDANSGTKATWGEENISREGDVPRVLMHVFNSLFVVAFVFSN